MRLVAVSLESISTQKYDKSKIFKMLQSFNESAEISVRLDFKCPDEYVSSSSAASTFCKATKHYNFCNIKVMQRKGNVYLIKKSECLDTLEDK